MRRICRSGLLALGVVWTGCGRTDLVDVIACGDGVAEPYCGAAAGDPLPDDLPADSEPPQGSWAAYVRTQVNDVFPFSVRSECPTDLLVVDTVDTAVEGGTSITSRVDAGAALSLVEALWIAKNNAAPVSIVFSPTLFPPEAPAEIVIGPDVLLPGQIDDMCVDARRRGVTLRWTDDSNGCGACRFPVIGDQAILVGVGVINPGESLILGQGGQIAGCRFNWGYTGSQRAKLLVAQGGGAHIGPGNSFLGSDASVSLVGFTGFITNNTFGVDALDGREQPMLSGLISNAATQYDAHIERNTFLTHSVAVSVHNALIRDNKIRGTSAATVTAAGLSVAGPAVVSYNEIRGFAEGVRVRGNTVRLSSNAIFGNGVGIVVEGTALEPPVITSLDLSTHPGAATGTCAAPGYVDVYFDRGNQGEVWTGSAQCDGVSPWTAGVHTVGLNSGAWNATATWTNNAYNATSPFSGTVSFTNP